jgi:hypothetical protein
VCDLAIAMTYKDLGLSISIRVTVRGELSDSLRENELLARAEESDFRSFGFVHLERDQINTSLLVRAQLTEGVQP